MAVSRNPGTLTLKSLMNYVMDGYSPKYRNNLAICGNLTHPHIWFTRAAPCHLLSPSGPVRTLRSNWSGQWPCATQGWPIKNGHKNWLNLDLNEDFISKHGWFDQAKTWGLGFSPDFAMEKWGFFTVDRGHQHNLDDPCLNLRFASKLMCCPFRDFLGHIPQCFHVLQGCHMFLLVIFPTDMGIQYYS